jgi:hypothetical protein
MHPVARDANPKRQQHFRIFKEHDDDCTATVTPPLHTRMSMRRGGDNAEHGGNGESGGADRDRTGDPLLAKQVLSQLSYSPSLVFPAAAPKGTRQKTIASRAHPGQAGSWWVWMDLNHRPHAYQACALTN